MNKVLIDSNVFLYFLLDSFTDDNCRVKIIALFNEIKDKNIKAFTTTRIVDEVVFKLILANSKYKTKAFSKLKNDKQEVKRLFYIYDDFFKFLREFAIEVVNVSKSDFENSASIVKEFGIFGNDALSLKVMLKKDIRYIATCDRDFNDIELIENILIGKA